MKNFLWILCIGIHISLWDKPPWICLVNAVSLCIFDPVSNLSLLTLGTTTLDVIVTWRESRFAFSDLLNGGWTQYLNINGYYNPPKPIYRLDNENFNNPRWVGGTTSWTYPKKSISLVNCTYIAEVTTWRRSCSFNACFLCCQFLVIKTNRVDAQMHNRIDYCLYYYKFPAPRYPQKWYILPILFYLVNFKKP